MSDLKISQLPALSGSDLASADQLAVVDSSASQTSKLTVGDLIANGVTLINDNTIPGAKILFDSGSIATAALADSGVTTVKIATDAITSAKIADNVIVALASTLPTSGGYIGQLALDTDDNSLYVWSGTTWLNTKAPASVNAFTDTTAGIINITTAVSSGTATVTASIDNTASAAQFLAGPVGSGGTVGYRTIDGGDLPTATTSAKGGVIVNGGGLSLSTDTIQIANSVSASSVKHLVTYDANGLITGGSAIASSDLPVATSSARGAVVASDGLVVDSSGNLSIDNTVTAGTYTKVTVTSKGVVSSGDTLAAADIPDHSAAKLTSGTIGSSLIANDSVTADKLANESTVKFGGALGSDNVTIFPAGDFKGQLFWDETSLDLYVYTGSAFIPITVLSGNLVNAGTYNANTNLVSSITTAGSSAGFAVGSALPAPVGTNLNHYVVVDTSGTGTGAAPSVALAPPDMLLSQGVGTEYSLIDVSNAIAGQTASNISFIASGTIAATDVQAALQEVDTEKLPKAGGTMTGNLNLGTSTNVVFEGSSADDYETTLTVTNPTADRTIALPNISGTVVTSGDTGSVTSTMIVDGAIVNADINASAEIAVSKLANGTARQLLQTDSGGTGVEFTSNVDVPGTLDVTSGATFDSTVAVTGLLSANGKLAYPAGTAAAVSLYSGTDTDTGIYSPGSNQFGIATAGTSRIVVDASGNVGIGTSNPITNLHIRKNNAGDLGGHLLLENRSVTADTHVQISFAPNEGDLARTAYIRSNNTATTRADLRFGTGNGHAPFERMRITETGNVGIGTTSPSSFNANANQLVIQNSGNCGITIDATSSTNSAIHFADGPTGSAAYSGYILYRHGEDSMAFGTNGGGERLKIDSSGRLLVGTSSASNNTGVLVVQGYAGITAGEGTLDLVRGNNVTAAAQGLGSINFGHSQYQGASIDAVSVGAWTESSSHPANLSFSTTASGASSPTERMLIESSGRTTFTYDDSSTDTSHTQVPAGIRINNQNNTSGRLAGIHFAHGGAGTANAGIFHVTTNTSTASTGCLGDLAFYLKANGASTMTERMRIDSSGRLLVGTTTEGAADADDLTLQAPSGYTGITLRSGTSDGGAIYFSDATSGAGEYDGYITYAQSNQTMSFGTAGNGSPRMLIESSGQVNVFASSTVHISRSGTGAGTVQWLYAGVHSATNASSGTVSFQVYTNGNVQNTNDSYGQISDVKLKENIVDAGSQWNDFKAVRFRKYNFKEETGHETHTQLGVIAQELELTSPGLVYETADQDEDGNDLGTTTKAVKSSILTKKALVALQEAMARIETLEQRLSDAGIA